MIKITIDSKQIDELRKSLKDKTHRLPRHMATAINATARKVRSVSAKGITEELAVPQKVVKDVIKEKSRATKDRLYAQVNINQTARIPLREFGARQLKATKRRSEAVTYRISKTAGRRYIEHNAFVIKQYGNHVYRRTGAGRRPIVKLYGPSPWGVFVKRNLEAKVMQIANEELAKQMARQIRQVLLGYSKYDK